MQRNEKKTAGLHIFPTSSDLPRLAPKQSLLFHNQVVHLIPFPSPISLGHSHLKHLLQNRHGLIRILDRVSRRPRILIDFIIVATLECLVSEEMDVLVIDARQVLLGLDVSETEGLVPSRGKDVEGDLTAYRVAVSRNKVSIRNQRPRRNG